MKTRVTPKEIACNCLALRQASRTITNVYDQVLSESGLRVTQFSILYVLWARKQMTIGEIAAELVMDRTTLTRNLKPLERDMLVVSGPGELDGRERVVSLSPAGKSKLKTVLPLWQKAQQAFETSFGAARADELRILLRDVVGTGMNDSQTN